MSEHVNTAVLGAYIFGAVFIVGLLLHGGSAAICGLLAAGAAYGAQTCESYRLMGVPALFGFVLGFWAISLVLALVGLSYAIGG